MRRWVHRAVGAACGAAQDQGWRQGPAREAQAAAAAATKGGRCARKRSIQTGEPSRWTVFTTRFSLAEILELAGDAIAPPS